ncbi:unnamed protein product [Ambrosiozyma monospora]|uniref:Unnamed protein product n=1 Tax=Ambrosiozyma monospora TaxID=43982 RepID=A0ACB5SRE9_AMBMO|nr:unnamed protein product [Ambrosiozyma monospora]
MAQPNNCSSTPNRFPEKFMNELTPIDPSECDADALVGKEIIQLFHESSKDLYNLFMNSQAALNEINGKAEQEEIDSNTTDSNTNTTDSIDSNTKNVKKSKFKEYHELLEFIDEHTRKFNGLLETLSEDQIEGIRAKSTTRVLLNTFKYLDVSPIFLELLMNDTANAIHLIAAMLKLMKKIISNPNQTYKFSPTMFFLFMQFAYGTNGIFKIRSANYERNSTPTLYLICKNYKRPSSFSSSSSSSSSSFSSSSSSSSSGDSTGRRVPSISILNKSKIDHCPVTYIITFDNQRNILSIKSTGQHNHHFNGDSGLNYLENTPIFLTKLLSYILSSGMPLGSSQTQLNQFLDKLDISGNTAVHKLICSFKQYTMTNITKVIGEDRILESNGFKIQLQRAIEDYHKMLADKDDSGEYKVEPFIFQVGNQERHGVCHISKSLVRAMIKEGVIYLDFTFKPIVTKGVAMGNIGFVNRNRVYVPCSILSEGGEGTNNVCQLLNLLEDCAQEISPELSLKNIVHIIIDQSSGEISGIKKFFLDRFGLADNSKVARKLFIEENIDNRADIIQTYFGSINSSSDPKLKKLQKKAFLAYISPDLFPTSSKILFCTWHKSVVIGKRFGVDTVDKIQYSGTSGLGDVEAIRGDVLHGTRTVSNSIGGSNVDDDEEEQVVTHSDIDAVDEANSTSIANVLVNDNVDEANATSIANSNDDRGADEDRQDAENAAPEEYVLPEDGESDNERIQVVTLLRRVMYGNAERALVSFKNLIEAIPTIKPGKHSKNDSIKPDKCLETLIGYFLNHDQWCLRFRTGKALERPSSQAIEVFHNMVKHPKNGMGGRTTLSVFSWFCTLRRIVKKFSWDWDSDHRYKSTIIIDFMLGNLNIPENKDAYDEIAGKIQRASNLGRTSYKRKKRAHEMSTDLFKCTLEDGFCPYKESHGEGVPCLHVLAAIVDAVKKQENMKLTDIEERALSHYKSKMKVKYPNLFNDVEDSPPVSRSSTFDGGEEVTAQGLGVVHPFQDEETVQAQQQVQYPQEQQQPLQQQQVYPYPMQHQVDSLTQHQVHPTQQVLELQRRIKYLKNIYKVNEDRLVGIIIKKDEENIELKRQIHRLTKTNTDQKRELKKLRTREARRLQKQEHQTRTGNITQQQHRHHTQLGQFPVMQIPINQQQQQQHYHYQYHHQQQQQQHYHYQYHHQQQQQLSVYRDPARRVQQQQHNLQLNRTRPPLREVTNSGQNQQQQNVQPSPVVSKKRRRFG